MASYNKVIMIGNLVRDPELKKTPNGLSVSSFTIAVNRKMKDSSGKYASDYFTVIAWRNTAEFVCKFFRKGNAILVDGQLQTRSYDDKNGNKVHVTEIVADSVTFGGNKNENQQEPEASTAPASDVAPVTESAGNLESLAPGEDLPF